MFLVFEGIDGSGKSTQARRLADHLERRGSRVVLVREPGGTPLGETLRGLVLGPQSGDLSPETELFLFMAARSHLVRRRILPALREGSVVISDRFLWSSVVYQGIRAGLTHEAILDMGRIAVAGLQPDRTFVIDVDPEVAFARVERPNRMEADGLELQKEVRAGFLSLAARFPETTSVVDGTGSPDEVFLRVASAVLPPP